jgi:hypothetical protein
MMIGTMVHWDPAQDQAHWSDICIAEQGAGTAIGTTAATKFFGIPTPGGTGVMSTMTACPAALSVQIMNGTALSSANGLITACVVPARLDVTNDPRTWGILSSNVTSFMRPRILTAGKLTLRGVQLDSFPLSMHDCSAFMPVQFAPDKGVNDVWDFSRHLEPKGWAPFFVSNPEGATLTYLVTIEWRVRFDIGNPAVSSHSHHGVSSDASWERHIQAAHRQLPGVLDIVEKVASTGLAVSKMVGAAMG